MKGHGIDHVNSLQASCSATANSAMGHVNPTPFIKCNLSFTFQVAESFVSTWSVGTLVLASSALSSILRSALHAHITDSPPHSFILQRWLAGPPSPLSPRCSPSPTCRLQRQCPSEWSRALPTLPYASSNLLLLNQLTCTISSRALFHSYSERHLCFLCEAYTDLASDYLHTGSS